MCTQSYVFYVKSSGEGKMLINSFIRQSVNGNSRVSFPIPSTIPFVRIWTCFDIKRLVSEMNETHTTFPMGTHVLFALLHTVRRLRLRRLQFTI